MCFVVQQFEQAQDAVTISNGNFFWGLKEEKEDKEKTKKKANAGEAKKAIKEKMKNKKQAPRKKVIDESFAVDTSQLLADSAEGEDEENVDNTTIENVLALRDINLNIKQGEFVCIIGDVGSGKSSLLNSMIGDLQYLDPAFISEYKDQKISEQDVIE